jgi:UDP-N-acetylmuramate dehydrogenase
VSVAIQLSEFTTLRLGGPAERLVEAREADALVAAIGSADAERRPVLLVAGGSNLVIADAGFDGTAVLVRTSGVAAVRDGDDVLVTVAAGQDWDAVVARAVAEGWSGIECLSGIPGSAGATPVQNVGAYGQEIREVFDSATVLDRRDGATRVFGPADCDFGYRHSLFKHNDRYVVLDVTLRLRVDARSAPIRYPETARSLGVEVGETVPLELARDTVLKLRRGKGMVLDPSDPDTFSAGSFFVNPVIDRSTFDKIVERTGETPVNFPADDDGVKLSAAWLIAHAGFDKGYGRDGVAISSKHTLALTNRGSGTTDALLRLAAEVRDGVAARYGVELRPEPVLVNASL